MSRIISGTARGRHIKVPPGGTRPTTDRVRESLFAALDHLIGGFAGKHVLDLYAGSGALGLEAASRGAEVAVLVERDRRTAAVARENAGVVGAAGVRVVPAAVSAFLAGAPASFDVVLADPPYDLPAAHLEAVLERICAGWLADGAIVVVERATQGGGFRWPTRIVPLQHRTYGGTTLWYGRRALDGQDGRRRAPDSPDRRQRAPGGEER
ncbi:MAG: 16S rRNA (guanine(966)-N(2))-methyltransferase RsmD [Candidatus Nanopelagicales bacterium]